MRLDFINCVCSSWQSSAHLLTDKFQGKLRVAQRGFPTVDADPDGLRVEAVPAGELMRGHLLARKHLRYPKLSLALCPYLHAQAIQLRNTSVRTLAAKAGALHDDDCASLDGC